MSGVVVIKCEQYFPPRKVFFAKEFCVGRGRGSGDSRPQAVTGEINEDESALVDSYNPANAQSFDGGGYFLKR